MGSERLFADTNVFLRYLTNDVPEQADAVEHLLVRVMQGEIVLVTNSLVIAEIVWTLDSYYKLSRSDIREKIFAILNTPGLEVVDEDLIRQAIPWYVEKNVDFIDAYNAAWALTRGIRSACTFDQKHFSRFEGIEVCIPGHWEPRSLAGR
jgi:predicted nucleic-acid-binding protein